MIIVCCSAVAAYFSLTKALYQAPLGSGNSLLGNKAEAHLEEGSNHGGPDEGTVALLPAAVSTERCQKIIPLNDSHRSGERIGRAGVQWPGQSR
jgi:hypothetical protein